MINISIRYIVLVFVVVVTLTTSFKFCGKNNRIQLRKSVKGPPRNPFSKILFMSDDNNNENDTSDDSIRQYETNNVLLKNWFKISKETRDDIKTSVFSFAFALFIRVVMFEPRYIPSLSMFPTFDIGDQLLVDKISINFKKHYNRRDVVVFNPTETYIDLTGNTEALIKRVVAVAGDVVEIKNNNLFVNDVMQSENYINEKPDYTFPPVTVPAGMLLVLGDNRNHSFDSHAWGFLPEDNVIGRAVLKYWPPWRAGVIEGSY